MPWIPLHQTWQISYLVDLPGRSTPDQSSIDALNTITPNLADLLGDLIFGRTAWQIYPHQSSIDALNTITPNLADLLGDLIFGRSAWQIYPPPIKHRCLEYHYTKLGRSTGRSHIWQIYPPPIEHRCLEYHFTKLGRSTGKSHIWQIYPHQSNIDALHTTTLHLADLPPSIEHRCHEYHYTKLGRSHIWQICLADLPPHQLSMHALHTITPNLADLLADLIFGRSTAISIKYRCLAYHYTTHGRSTGRSTPSQLTIDALHNVTPNMADLLADVPPQLSIHALHTITPNLADLLADLIFSRSTGRFTGRYTPPSIEHRCLAYHYTTHGRSTPSQLCIDALHNVTPNMADLLADVPPQLSIDALHTITPNMADLPPGQSSIDGWHTFTPNMADVLADLPTIQSSIDALHTFTPNMADLLADLAPVNWA